MFDNSETFVQIIAVPCFQHLSYYSIILWYIYYERWCQSKLYLISAGKSDLLYFDCTKQRIYCQKRQSWIYVLLEYFMWLQSNFLSPLESFLFYSLYVGVCTRRGGGGWLFESGWKFLFLFVIICIFSRIPSQWIILFFCGGGRHNWLPFYFVLFCWVTSSLYRLI